MNKELLTELFNTDKELLSKYHIEAPNSAEICAERTLNDLNNNNIEIHLIEQNDKVIGYYGIERGVKTDSLSGFFITPEFRNKEIVSKFWKEIESHFNKDFYTGVHSKNTRAIEFLRKKTNIEFRTEHGTFFKIKR